LFFCKIKKDAILNTYLLFPRTQTLPVATSGGTQANLSMKRITPWFAKSTDGRQLKL
jgi:hypothetical protein